MGWLTSQMREMSTFFGMWAKCINEDLPAALGAPGVPGDPVKMLSAVDGLFECCRGFLAFERSIRAADSPKSVESFE
jgi:hypothetical protein